MVQPIQTTQCKNQLDITFHVARDPEFLEGVQHGRQLIGEWDLTNFHGWRNVDEVLQFVQHELSSENQGYENQVRVCFDAIPRTPIYHLGLVAGYLGVFAEVALTVNSLTTMGGNTHV